MKSNISAQILRIFSSCFKFLRVSLETSANEMYQGLRLASELPGSLQKVLRGREEGALVWEVETDTEGSAWRRVQP